MKRICILGHFGFGKEKNNGQTIKTKIITTELQKVYGLEAVGMEDTMGGWKFLLRMPFIVLRMLIRYHNIIIMPAYKGARIISPFLLLCNYFFHRQILYVAIGGWLPEYARKYNLLRIVLQRYDGIFVETTRMKRDMDALHFDNVYIMPNFKSLPILSEKDINCIPHKPFRLCTFSRVIKEKGIAEAIEAVKRCNSKNPTPLYTLDIYGIIEQKEWFTKLMANQPKEIQYKGIVDYSKSVETLKYYYLLLFPTYYKGECFAGTLLDALAAGLPVLASNWHDNADIITDGMTGKLFTTHSVEELEALLLNYAKDFKAVVEMKKFCLIRAESYRPERIISILTQHIV